MSMALFAVKCDDELVKHTRPLRSQMALTKALPECLQFYFMPANHPKINEWYLYMIFRTAFSFVCPSCMHCMRT